MKKFAMLALAMSLFLVACGEKKAEEKPAEQPVAEATQEAPAVEAMAYTVKTADAEYSLSIAGDVATLTAADGTATELTRAESADGEKFADANGNELHIKGEEGMLSLGEAKDVNVTVTEVAAQ